MASIERALMVLNQTDPEIVCPSDSAIARDRGQVSV